MKRENRIFFKSAVAVCLLCNVMFICGSIMGCSRDEIVFEQETTGASGTVSSGDEMAFNQESTDASGMVPSGDEMAFNQESTDASGTMASGDEMQDKPAYEATVAQDSSLCYVDVTGAVVNPGVYEVMEGTRVYEVLMLAGGMTDEAETECINQAIAVYDGLKLIVPTKEEWASGKYAVNDKEFVIRSDEMSQSSQSSDDSNENDGLVNINTASTEELCTLPGVGTAKAESIIAYREEHGPFQNIEDIKNVDGIKEGLFEKIKSKIKCSLE